jgi:hypothetical protein
MNAIIPPARGQNARREVEWINVEELHFDPENPRLPLKLRGADELQVFSFLLRECSLVELMLSIGSQGFFEGEPLLVVPRAAGGFTVVEGNRRLGAVKLLRREEPPPVFVAQVTAARQSAAFKPDAVPVLRFGTRAEILVYLGYRHITGVNEWGALEKARYLLQLSNLYGDRPDKYKILAQQIGSRADYVAQMLNALGLVESANDAGFFERSRVDVDGIPFSLLTTALSYRSIADFVSSGGEQSTVNIQRLFSWLFVPDQSGSTRVGESRNLRMLARVVSSEKALQAFERGAPLEEADLFTDGPLLLVQRMLSEAERRISTAQENLKFVTGLTRADAEAASTVERVARQLKASIEEEIRASGL